MTKKETVAYWGQILNSVSEPDRRARITAKQNGTIPEIKTRGYVIPHLGLEDMFWINGAVRYISTLFDTVTVVCKKEFEQVARTMYSDDPAILLHTINDDADMEPFVLYKSRLEAEGYKVFVCGVRASNPRIHEYPHSFYDDFGIPRNVLKDYFHIQKTEEGAYIAETLNYAVSLLGAQGYIVLNQQSSKHFDKEKYLLLDLNENLYEHDHPFHALAGLVLDKTIIDYIPLLDGASEIQGMEGPVNCLTQLLGLPVRNTVIFAWAQKACNRDTTNFWGLGDIIRGLVYTYTLCKRMNVRLFVDFSMHPLSKFIKRQDHPYHAYVDSMVGKIPFIEGRDVEHVINSYQLPIFITNGEMYKGELPNDCKTWIRSLFSSYVPSDTPVAPFKALHMRLGDQHMISNETGDYSKAYEIYKVHTDKDTILFSDCKKFKMYVKSRDPSARMFDVDIAHLGVMDNSSGIEGTLREYFMLSKASCIKTYSTYPWISGFVHSISKVYDVPIISLK
jgi:hypothetical protein